jgi:hypothetical protein
MSCDIAAPTSECHQKIVRWPTVEHYLTRMAVSMASVLSCLCWMNGSKVQPQLEYRINGDEHGPTAHRTAAIQATKGFGEFYLVDFPAARHSSRRKQEAS